jgi:hypothetical protein
MSGSFIEYILNLYKPETEEEERELTLGNDPFLSLEEPKLEELTCPDCHTLTNTSILRVFAPSIRDYVEIPVHHAKYSTSEEREKKCVRNLMMFIHNNRVTKTWADSDSPDLARLLRGRPILLESHEDTLKAYASMFQAVKDRISRPALYGMFMELIRE